MPHSFRSLRLALAALLPLAAAAAVAQSPLVYDNASDIQADLAQARRDSAEARARAAKLEAEAAQAVEAADRTAREAAAVAARIQQAQADIEGDKARLGLIDKQRGALRARLAEKQRPLVRLTASLQRLSRRPPILSLLRAGSVRDTMHARAVLATILPEVEKRTASLRAELERGRALQEQTRLALAQLKRSQVELGKRRLALGALETRQRLASRATGGVADREAERALALAERSRDLDALSQTVSEAGSLRSELAALPGPILRPTRPDMAQVDTAATASATPPAGLPAYVLPASGKLVAGFGELPRGLPRSRGIVLAVGQGAQAVAPAPGRVAFAGPYRGYGMIVIIEHDGGWTSLITGLAQLDTRIGEKLVMGSPLGIAGAGRPLLTLELRRGNEAVNPLDYIRRL
jgi:septal ring factor EnvC (AmiA/AmiB activator)